jgi:hypothetical protein
LDAYLEPLAAGCREVGGKMPVMTAEVDKAEEWGSSYTKIVLQK